MKLSIAFAFFIAHFLSITPAGGQGIVHIFNTLSPTLEDGMLNIAREDTSTVSPIDILALHRLTTGTPQIGMGGSILFRNELIDGSLGPAARISAIAKNLAPGISSQALQIDVFNNNTVSRSLYLSADGLGIGTTDPVSMVDINSPFSVPLTIRGGANLYIPIYESTEYRGYLGSYAGAAQDMDIGTGASNTAGKLHLTIQAVPKVTIDANGQVGVNTTTPASLLDIEGKTTLTTHLVSSRVNYDGNSDVRAVEGHSITNPGYGIGGHFTGGWQGVLGTAQASDYAGTAYGGYFTASGSAGTRTAIYGSASGGVTNWAGFFGPGNVYIQHELRIGTGDGAAGYKVAVNGKLIAEEVRIQDSGDWPDYVFAPEYDLRTISEVQTFIAKAGHLPGVPDAEQVAAEGIVVGEMQKRMMEKIEELTLYIIQLHERIEELEHQLKRR